MRGFVDSARMAVTLYLGLIGEEKDHLGEPGAPQCSLLASRTRTQGCSNQSRCSRGRLAFRRLLHQWL